MVSRVQIAVVANGGDYKKVLMALVEVDDETEIVYIALPSLDLAAPSAGYGVTSLHEKPVASLLVGNPDEFERHFRSPTFGAQARL